MKRTLSILLCLCLCLASGCAPAAEPAPARLSYPAVDEVPAIFDETGLTAWTLDRDGVEEVAPPLENGAPVYNYTKGIRCQLYNQDKSVRCQFAAVLSHIDTPRLQITFWYDETSPLTAEQYQRFLTEELPEIWSLAAALCDDGQAVTELGSQLEAAYKDVVEPYTEGASHSLLCWGEQNAGIYASAEAVVNDSLGQPVWTVVRLLQKEEYNYPGIVDEDRLATVRELAELDPLRDDVSLYYAVYGKLSDIKPDDSVDLSHDNRASLPDNAWSYQSAMLKDESGELFVYIAPTALSGEELSEERLHRIAVIRNDNYEPIYVIDRSCINQPKADEK